MFSREEIINYWLLNLAVEMPIWLYLIFPEVSTQALNVYAVPGCESKDYANQLLELWGSGMVEISSEVPGDEVESASGVTVILDRFLHLPTGDPFRSLKSFHRHRLPNAKVNFKLTASGGAAWEKIAEPCWANFVSDCSDFISGDLISENRDLLMAYLGWYSLSHHEERIEPDTIVWKTHEDFNVLYWKSLPRVYHVSFALQVVKRESHTSDPDWFTGWYRSIRSWHKEPWQLPGWPSK